MLIASKLYYFDSLESTNEYAKTLIKDAPEGAVILVDQQTGGRGRFGKQWYSPEGGIWMSVILRPPDPSLITIIAGIAVCRALHMNGVLPGIKWPNDIVLNGKKIGGTLTEIIDKTVILGIGVNLNIRDFPDELEAIASSVFLETKKHLKKKLVFDTLCKQLDDCYIMLKQNKITDLLTEWRHYTILLGQQVVIEMPDKELSGKVLDISRDGALIVMRSDGKIMRVVAGVCHLRKK
jgi:BirA family biotin operon repressor/biotin-[acetyl-CoA-carboxylase] ligase